MAYATPPILITGIFSSKAAGAASLPIHLAPVSDADDGDHPQRIVQVSDQAPWGSPRRAINFRMPVWCSGLRYLS